MIGRRVRGNFAKLNWFAVTVDLAIVVIGVFLGTQASNWNQDRLDRRRGAEYRRRLVIDLAATERVMAALQAYSNEVKGHGEAAIAVIEEPSRPAGKPFLIDAYQASQALVYSSRHVTYDEIVSAGGLELVGPPALRQKISNYYWRMDRLLGLDAGSSTYREMLRTAMPNAVQRAIRANCDERRTNVGDYLIIPSLPATCEVAVDPAVAALAAARVRAWPGLGDTLNRQLSSNDSRTVSYTALADGARQIRAAIDAYDR